MTITDLINDNEGALGARMTIYRKMKKLTKAGYIKKDALITMQTHSISWKGDHRIWNKTWCSIFHQ